MLCEEFRLLFQLSLGNDGGVDVGPTSHDCLNSIVVDQYRLSVWVAVLQDNAIIVPLGSTLLLLKPCKGHGTRGGGVIQQ